MEIQALPFSGLTALTPEPIKARISGLTALTPEPTKARI
jgi:hypothetical protein